MFRYDRLSPMRTVIGAVALAAGALLLNSSLQPAFAKSKAVPRASIHDAAAEVHTVLIFPFANNAGADAASAASGVAQSVKVKLNYSGFYQVTAFSPALPAAQRAITDGVLKETDLAGPFTDKTIPQKIASLTDSDGFIIGSVESRAIDTASGKVTITADATLYKTDSSAQLKTAAATGVGTPAYVGEDPATVEQRAVDAVATSLVQQLEPVGSASVAEAIPDTTRGSHISPSPILMVVLAGLLVAVVAHNVGTDKSSGGGSSSSTGGGTGGGGGGGGNPPSPPIF
jgi:hypothetical protein